MSRESSSLNFVKEIENSSFTYRHAAEFARNPFLKRPLIFRPGLSRTDTFVRISLCGRTHLFSSTVQRATACS